MLECRKKHITKVDILEFEFAMGQFPNVLDAERAKGIDIAPKGRTAGKSNEAIILRTRSGPTT